MKAMEIVAAIAIMLVIALAYADRQQADEQAKIKESAATKANAKRAARDVEWVGLDKVGKYMTSFDQIK